MIGLRVKAWALGRIIYWCAVFSLWIESQGTKAIYAKQRCQSEMARKEQARVARLEARAWTR